MQEQKLAETSKSFSVEELKQFARQTGPFATILAPSRVAGGAGKKLSSRLRRMANKADLGGDGVALFAVPGECRQYWLPQSYGEAVVVADNLFIRPLIGLLDREKEFYVLALAQGNTRLLRCSEFTSEESPLPPSTPTNIDEYMNLAKPDHVLDNRQTLSPVSGAPAVMFGTSADREARDGYLENWMREVARGVDRALKDAGAPLILCCVEYEQPLYRQANLYPRLLDETVIGAPDGFKGGELHKRALEALVRHREASADEVLKGWEKQTGEYAKAGVKDIVKAAYEGRVLHLFIAETAHVTGSFNEATFQAEGSRELRPWDEDLLNAAALQTLIHSGDVFVVPQSKIPENRPMAAIMRW